MNFTEAIALLKIPHLYSEKQKNLTWKEYLDALIPIGQVGLGDESVVIYNTYNDSKGSLSKIYLLWKNLVIEIAWWNTETVPLRLLQGGEDYIIEHAEEILRMRESEIFQRQKRKREDG